MREQTVCVSGQAVYGMGANRTGPVGCAPGRAAKGAIPVDRTKNKTLLYAGSCFCVNRNFDRN